MGALTAGACSTNEAEEPGGAGGAPADGVSAEGGPETNAERSPLSLWEPNLPTEGQFCSFLVPLECDGSEDCADGEVCCGILEGGSFSYLSVRCQESCTPADGGIEMCHEGETCPNPDHVCRRSLILPSYMAICETESAFAPTEFDGASAAAGVVNCGAGLACGPGEICCSLASWDADSQAASFIDGRCVTDPADCGCKAGTEPKPAATESLIDGGAPPDEPPDDGGPG